VPESSLVGGCCPKSRSHCDLHHEGGVVVFATWGGISPIPALEALLLGLHGASVFRSFGRDPKGECSKRSAYHAHREEVSTSIEASTEDAKYLRGIVHSGGLGANVFAEELTGITAEPLRKILSSSEMARNRVTHGSTSPHSSSMVCLSSKAGAQRSSAKRKIIAIDNRRITYARPFESVRVPQVREEHEPPSVLELARGRSPPFRERIQLPRPSPNPRLLRHSQLARGQLRDPAHLTKDAQLRDLVGLGGGFLERLPRPLEGCSTSSSKLPTSRTSAMIVGCAGSVER